MGPKGTTDSSNAVRQADSRPSFAADEPLEPHADVQGPTPEIQQQATARAELDQTVQHLRADLARLKQQEASLQLDRELYRTLLESAGDAIVLLNEKGVFEFSNTMACQIAGRHPGSLTGLTLWDLLSQEAACRYVEMVRRIIHTGRPETIESLENVGGRKRWFNVRVVPVHAGRGNAAAMAVARDITDRREGESALGESEERYRLLFESAFDAVILYDTATGSFLDANQTARALYGYSRQEFQQMTVDRISAEPDSSREVIHQAVTNGVCNVPVRYHRKKDGTVFPVEATVTSFSLGGRTVLCSVLRDISGRIAAEKQAAKYRYQLRGMALQLSLAEEQERRRLAVRLHDELGQFLTLAQLKMGLLTQQAPQLDPADRKLLTDIDELLSRANRSARSLTLQLSHPALYDLGFVPAAEWLCEEMRRLYNLNVQMSDDGQPKAMDVSSRVVLFQSLREILINVAKHAQVSTARLDIQRVDSTVVVSVQDQGTGFDACFSSSRGRASGFGLFSVRERLQHLGGECEIESAPGRGTRVRLQIPLTTGTEKGQGSGNPCDTES